MILISSAKYCSNELQAEFGKVVPSFLPLGAKRLYEHQITLLKKSSKDQIVLSLPRSFKLSKFEQKRIENLGANILFVPDFLNLNESIKFALNMNLPLSKPLKILHGDTLFKTLPKGANLISVSKAHLSYDWANLESIKCENIEFDLNEFVINGYFAIKFPYDFIKALQISSDFISALKIYSHKHPFKVRVNDTWLDFGLLSSFYASKSTITTQRHFNALFIKNGFVLKTSKNADKIKAEYAWFKALPKDLCLFVPKIYATKNGYKSEYLCLNTLAEIFVFGALPRFAFENIFKMIRQFLDKIHALKFIKSANLASNTPKIPNFNYCEKTLTRLKDFARQRKISLKREFLLNGKLTPSLNFIVNSLDEFIRPNSEFCFIHGDFCFSNIMFDFKSMRPIFIDPRACDFRGVFTPFGDKRYDLAKLAHSVLGLYDFIVFGFFECEFKDYAFKFELKIPQNVREIQALFMEIFNFDFKEILALCVHLFLSMLPLHADDKMRQNALLANALRLYLLLKDEA